MFSKKEVGRGEYVIFRRFQPQKALAIGNILWNILDYTLKQITIKMQCISAENFVSIYNNKKQNIIEQLDKSITIQSEDRKKRLVPNHHYSALQYPNYSAKFISDDNKRILFNCSTHRKCLESFKVGENHKTKYV